MPDLTGHELGRYHLLEKLGEGGMAIVYKAFDTRLECEVAVKVIRTDQLAPAVLERALKRFEREAKAVARLTHPAIVRVTDYGEYEGSPYLVMEYLPGGTLKEYLIEHGRLDYKEAARLLLPIAEALDYAHEQNLIHRDVKPSNILLTSKSQSMLTDFGVAKVIDEEVTQDLTGTSATVGTPEYMAPEQVVSKTVDHRADIYALGVVLFEMVTGRRPFEADTPMAVLFKHAGEPLPRPSTFSPDLPDAVERILFKALAKKPEDRYQSMGEFASALSLVEREGKSGAVSTATQPTPIEKIDETLATQDQFEEESLHAPPPAIQKERTPITPPRAAHKERNWLTAAVLGLLVVVVVLIIGGVNGWFGATPTEAPVARPTASLTTPPALVHTTTARPTNTAIPATPTEALGIGSTQVSPKDDMVMVYVPAGEFSMGSDDGESTEKPVHTVALDAYWIDQTEVTNAMYAQCVADGKCTIPSSSASYLRSSYYGNSQYADYPVIYVDWSQAQAYCQWAGRELPTEAQWEKAARGTDGRTYPWGNNAPDGNLVNFADINSNYSWSDKSIDDGYADTSPVGTYPGGKSLYDVYDLAGNVWEWVADWFDSSYYGSQAQWNNPTGPASPAGPGSGEDRVIRGGNFRSSAYEIRSANRAYPYPSTGGESVGFRCSQLINFQEGDTNSTLEINSTPTLPLATLLPSYPATTQAPYQITLTIKNDNCEARNFWIDTNLIFNLEPGQAKTIEIQSGIYHRFQFCWTEGDTNPCDYAERHTYNSDATITMYRHSYCP